MNKPEPDGEVLGRLMTPPESGDISVVVIEDDPSISELLQLYLTREGYAVRAAMLGGEGIELVRERTPALVVLDLMLPDLSGFDVLKAIRGFSKVPLIVLTARDAEQDKILGLELGADDYMVKPFSPGELVARARAILRRAGQQEDPANLTQTLGGVELHPGERTVQVDGATVDLTPKEFELLHYLLINRGLALSRERLLEEVWGYTFYGDARTVDVHVGQLRKKLGPWGSIIQTVWGLGYRADPTVAARPTGEEPIGADTAPGSVASAVISPGASPRAGASLDAPAAARTLQRVSPAPRDEPLRPRGSIRSRLILALAGVSIFTLVVVGIVFYVFLGGYVVDRQKEQLVHQAIVVAEQVEGLAANLPGGLTGGKVLPLLLRTDLRVLSAGAGIVVFQDSGMVTKVGVVPLKAQGLLRLQEEGLRLGGVEPGAGLVRSLPDQDGGKIDVLVAAAPIQGSGGSRGLAVVTLATTEAFAARGGLLRMLLISGAIAIALAIAVGLGLGSWMARPLRVLSATARSMAGGSYDRPITGTYPGEVQELATSLETMRREVRHSEESLRGFVASAAHELRTPLTSIQGFSQALLDGTAATADEQQRSAAAIYRESARLQRLVDALLTLSRYDSGEFRPGLAPVDVDALVKEEVDRLVQIGLTEPGRVHVAVAPAVRLVSDSDMLRQVVGNLLRNAVQYGADDPIAVLGWQEGEEVLLEVTNGGTPLDPEERSHLFERFFRGREGRNSDGFGLGLALVREICEVLGGRVGLTGEGPLTVFRVTIPSGTEVAPGEPA